MTDNILNDREHVMPDDAAAARSHRVGELEKALARILPMAEFAFNTNPNPSSDVWAEIANAKAVLADVLAPRAPSAIVTRLRAWADEIEPKWHPSAGVWIKEAGTPEITLREAADEISLSERAHEDCRRIDAMSASWGDETHCQYQEGDSMLVKRVRDLLALYHAALRR